jgi:hypothetical protein
MFWIEALKRILARYEGILRDKLEESAMLSGAVARALEHSK